MSSELADLLRTRMRGRVTARASLAPFTTFRVGGSADVLVEAETVDDLCAVAELRDQAPVAIVGRGSNMLVSDKGFDGIAVRLGRAFRYHERTDEGLRLGGATFLPAVARLTAQMGLEGFEFAAEIPASFGGAVAMNAGAHDREMADVVVRVGVVDLSDGGRRELEVAELSYGYRRSGLGHEEIVTGGEIRLESGDPAAVAARIAEHLQWRRSNQPPGRSAGSVFKNPPGDSAGRLIDACGGKAMRVGGAEVSAVHANFIVADRNATATDVWKLVREIRELVKEHAGVSLEPEVRLLGPFSDADEDA